jgi:hypothetical protein
MRAASWFTAGPPQADGSRWISERHVVAGVRHEFKWLCHRRIDPKTEVDRRARELVAASSEGVR